jgi:hypothetical protein
MNKQPPVRRAISACAERILSTVVLWSDQLQIRLTPFSMQAANIRLRGRFPAARPSNYSQCGQRLVLQSQTQMDFSL